jgi:glutaredoxin
MYYFNAILLEDCPYSMSADKLLKNYNIKSNIILVNSSNKDTYKTDKINTFPQIYLKKHNSVGNVLIGGYNDLKNLTDLVYKKKFNDEIIKTTMNKYNLSKKTSLRVYQLINSIKID